MIVLASTSPRRVDLMKQVGFKFEIVSPLVDETPKRGEKPEKLVARLAFEKANSVVHQFPDRVILAADTIVVTPDSKKILGKPASVSDAEKMLKLISGKTHTVLTGYCVIARGKPLVRVIKTKVTMRKLDTSAIRRYIATGEPMDKAGAYAAQGIGMALIEKIAGSYTNVVGLPIAEVARDLEKVFDQAFLEWLR